jgi:RNA polymerase sigma factor (sigma-70 family)
MKARRDGPARKGGDRLGELFLMHASEMGRLAYLMTGDRATADDLVQEAFIRLARRFTHLRDVDAFDSYFRRTIVNLACSHHRHRRVERSYGERVAALPKPSADLRMRLNASRIQAEHGRVKGAELIEQLAMTRQPVTT